MKILWVGVLTSNEAVKKIELVSSAANHWQSQFITGLNNNGASTICLSWLPSRYWPIGIFKPKFDEVDLPKNFKTYGVSYYNIPLIRELSLGWSLIKTIKKHKIVFDLLITFNPFKRHLMLGKYAQKMLNKKWDGGAGGAAGGGGGGDRRGLEGRAGGRCGRVAGAGGAGGRAGAGARGQHAGQYRLSADPRRAGADHLRRAGSAWGGA